MSSTLNELDLQAVILEHLYEVAVVKRAMLQAATTLAEHNLTVDAAVLLQAVKHLTRSCNRLLGDTQVD